MHKVFLNSGFTPNNSVEIISTYPSVLHISTKNLENRLEMWHYCQFSNSQLYQLFVQCPELLDFSDEQHLYGRYGDLRVIARTPKNIWRLLMASPNVLVDSMKSIREKVDYVLNVMKADDTDLLKSGTLGISLNKIKCRHMLLVRLGFYKPKKAKASPLDPNKNPRLFRIMDASDEEFAGKTAQISMKELEAFYDLYTRELLEKQKEEEEYYESIEEGFSSDDDDADGEETEFDARENADFYDDRNKKGYERSYRKNKRKS